MSTAQGQFERNVADGQGVAIFDDQQSYVIISKCNSWYNTAPYSDAGAINLDEDDSDDEPAAATAL